MTVESIRVQKWTCDGCGREQIVDPNVFTDVKEPNGYHGQVFAILEHGGSGNQKWFACTENCIQKAVFAAVNRGFHGD